MIVPKKLLVAERYRFTKTIRSSRRSVAWLAEDQLTGKTVVARTESKHRLEPFSKLPEARHPHLASVLEVLQDVDPASVPMDTPPSDYAVIIGEHVPGATVKDHVATARMRPVDAALSFARVASALDAMHRVGCAHGAVSCSSIVFEQASGIERPKLTQLLSLPRAAYCSPERAAGGGPSADDDVWALHVALFVALTRTLPFAGKTLEQIQENVRSGNLRALDNLGLHDPTLQQLLEKGLVIVPQWRRRKAGDLERVLDQWGYQRASIPEVLKCMDADQPSTFPSALPVLDGDPEATRAPAKPTDDLRPPLSQETKAQVARHEEPAEDAIDTEIMSNTELPDLVRASQRSEPRRRTHPRQSPAMAHRPIPPSYPRAPAKVTGSAQLARPKPASPKAPPPPVPRARRDVRHTAVRPTPLASQRQQPPPLPAEARSSPRAPSPATSPLPGPVDDSPPIASTTPHPATAPAADAPSPIEPSPTVADSLEPPPSEATPIGTSLPVFSNVPESAAELTATEGETSRHKTRSRLLVFALPLTVVLAGGVAAYRVAPERFEPLIATMAKHMPLQVRKYVVELPRTTTAADAPAASVVSASPVAAGGPSGSANSVGSSGTDGDASAAPADSQNAAITPSPSAAASAPEHGSPRSLGSCLSSFFEPGSFVPGLQTDFRFLCAQTDLREVNAGILHTLVAHSVGKVTAGMRTWSAMGWYNLPATAMIRGTCCPPDTAPIQVPMAPPPCNDSMRVALQKLAVTPPSAERARELSDGFTEAVTCLYAQGLPRPYYYRERPNQPGSDQFVRFIERAAIRGD